MSQEAGILAAAPSKANVGRLEDHRILASFLGPAAEFLAGRTFAAPW
jgi:hypothetical protein